MRKNIAICFWILNSTHGIILQISQEKRSGKIKSLHVLKICIRTLKSKFSEIIKFKSVCSYFVLKIFVDENILFLHWPIIMVQLCAWLERHVICKSKQHFWWLSMIKLCCHQIVLTHCYMRKTTKFIHLICSCINSILRETPPYNDKWRLLV